MYFWNFLKAEISNGKILNYKEYEYEQKRENVYLFLRLPWVFEKFVFYGFLQCADSFLYICTFLPLRIMLCLIQSIINPFEMLTNLKKFLEPPQIIDLCKLFLMTTCYYILTCIDTSMVYHIIRGQTIVKLYIFYNMLEVADRLLSSIGQDVLDALFWTATEPKKSKIFVLPHLLFSSIYIFVHSIVILCQTTILNVAFNSHNKALLTIMLSNNFVELKGSVFKKYDKQNVFLMSCNDIKERFNFSIMLLIILIRNMAEFEWDLDQLFELIPHFLTIFISEFIVDWIKQAFVIKFNNFSVEAFKEFRMILANDLIESRLKNTYKHHSDFQSYRFGLTPIPLFCLLFRICTQSIKLTNFLAYANVIIGFLSLISLKILNDVILVGLSSRWICNENKKNSDETVLNKSIKERKTSQPVDLKVQARNKTSSISNDISISEKNSKKNLIKKNKTIFIYNYLKCKRFIFLTKTSKITKKQKLND